jgi:hypothetical protein
LSYAKNYKLLGTNEKTDDQVTTDDVTSLSLTNLKAYTECAGAGGSSEGEATATATATATEGGSTTATTAEGEKGGTSGKGPVVGGKELTCDDETYIKPVLDGFVSTFENYKSCDEETQKYILETSGYETELQAGKNGNSNKYGLGMMCVDGNMYYIYTKDTEQATWDALKASPPDESGVVMKCLLKEGSGSSGGKSDPPSTSPAVRAVVGMMAVLGVCMLA